jgi:hypothetical protein
LENLDDEVDINRDRATIREDINISAEENLGYYEVRKYKPGSMTGAQNYLI